eukprot:TRINITY_DN6109_c0_g1_i2.p1 TRINITY_DN6109_c0_g1~~TRINITY_DN6109_c0_g1_i2.p1  ORF type:complete len:350 (+),score=113.82 TRINITY_DN6109_c0_g1_i2:52-1101(+)
MKSRRVRLPRYQPFRKLVATSAAVGILGLLLCVWNSRSLTFSVGRSLRTNHRRLGTARAAEEDDFFRGFRDMLGSKESDLENQLSAQKKLGEAANGQVKQLESELSSQRQEVSQLGDQLQQSESKVDQLGQDLEKSRKEKAEAAKAAEAAAAAAAAKANQLGQELEKSRKESAEAAEAAEVAVAAAAAEVGQLQGELEKVREQEKAKAAKAEESIQAFTGKISKLESDLAETEGIVTTLKAEMVELTTQLKNELAEKDGLLEQIATLKGSYEQVSDMLESSQSQEETGRKENQRLTSSLEDANGEIARLDDLLTERSAALDAAEEKLSTVKGSLGAAASAFVNKLRGGS